MSHLDYYQYQATARGIHQLADVERIARDKAHVYDQLVRPWLPSDPRARVAELACGHGSFLCWLRDRGCGNVTGVDSSAEQIALARQTGAAVVQSDALAWLTAQPDAGLHALVAIDFIEHISKDAVMDLLRESRRVLAPGGRLILRYPNGDSPLVGMNLFNDITHVWTYTPNCLNSLAEMHGFTRSEFADEGDAIRDQRWLKVPLSRISRAVLGALLRAATKEKVTFWGPHLWAALQR
ncbi:MAG: hypothetical protein RJA22_1778 [Verrucomicrobiota bacterium]|jgi:SAM-dependent methyltransferase